MMKTAQNHPPLAELAFEEDEQPVFTGQKAYLQTIRKYWKTVASYGIVWSWNFLFTAVVLFGILPTVVVGLWHAMFAGVVPLGFFLNAMVLLLMPFVSMAVMLIWLRKKPLAQLKLFYGIQAPIYLICLLRLFLIRELTSGLAFLGGVMLVGMAALLLHLRWDPEEISQSPPTSRDDAQFRQGIVWLQFAGLSALLVVGGYFALLLAFHCLPLFFIWLLKLLTFQWVGPLLWALMNPGSLLWIVLFGAPLMGFSATLFLGMPVGLAWIYTGAWRKTYRTLQAQGSQFGARLVACVVCLGVLWGGIHLNHQPQVRAFAAFATPPKSKQELRSLLARKAQLREGLLNAYLAGYRYMASTKRASFVKGEYQKAFGLPSNAAQYVQDTYNWLAAPFIYKGGPLYREQDNAEARYAQFFDRPIQKAERKAIIHALTSTYQPRQAEAGVLKIGERKVRLVAQHITLKEHGDWADVELQEIYQNQTRQQQEIFYYFSLPEGAVVTGLWLSNKPHKKDGFKYVVAPRGAAQRVYKRQVRRRVDPALLEQVGPRQYRLRAFPIPPQPMPHWDRNARRYNAARIPAPKFYLWMRFKVLAHANAARWPMPVLTQKRNVFWDHSTKMTLNGVATPRPDDRWLQASIDAQSPIKRRTHQLQLGPKTQLKATPYTPPASPTLPQGKRFAVVLDRSYSMNAHRDEVTKLFAWMKQRMFSTNQVDLYLTASPHRGERALKIAGIKQYNAANTIYFGGHRLGAMLAQFDELRDQQRYDGVFMLTDGHSYDLEKDRKKPFAWGAPLWIIHLGGRLAHAYEDATLETIQTSGGGVSTSLQRVLHKMAARHKLPDHLQKGLLHVEGGYIWQRLPASDTNGVNNPQASAQAAGDGFGAIAAGQLILSSIRSRQVQKLGVLDAIHAMAKRYSVVSPYSSMIVLVNQRQRDELKREAARKDRFKRTTEDGKVRLTTPSNPLSITGTPEPHEWLLIILVLLGLAAHMRKKTTPQPHIA